MLDECIPSQAPSQPSRCVCVGGGGLNLDGWNTIYRVWLGCLYHGRNKESSSNRRGWLISHSGAYFHL